MRTGCVVNQVQTLVGGRGADWLARSWLWNACVEHGVDRMQPDTIAVDNYAAANSFTVVEAERDAPPASAVTMTGVGSVTVPTEALYEKQPLPAGTSKLAAGSAVSSEVDMVTGTATAARPVRQTVTLPSPPDAMTD